MFAALDDPQRARLYYLLAAVYAVPSLRNGFTLDSFSIACLLLGIAHVQARGAPCTPLIDGLHGVSAEVGCLPAQATGCQPGRVSCTPRNLANDTTPSVPWHVRLCIWAGAYAGPHPWMGSLRTLSGRPALVQVHVAAMAPCKVSGTQSSRRTLCLLSLVRILAPASALPALLVPERAVAHTLEVKGLPCHKTAKVCK